MILILYVDFLGEKVLLCEVYSFVFLMGGGGGSLRK